jgi:hypothetical protein
MDLSQIATSATDASLSDYLFRGLGALAFALLGWVVRKVSQISATIDRWDVAFFGINGDNGINGNVKTLMQEREDEMRGRRHFNRREDDQ